MILDEIAAYTKERIEYEKSKLPLNEIRAQAKDLNADTGYIFEKALAKPGISFICEAKKASPSKGAIAEDFPYVRIAKEYEAAGADAMSVLTEPKWFMGKDEYLKEIRKEITIPIIRKDFTVDEYMIYQAKLMGADAVTYRDS